MIHNDEVDKSGDENPRVPMRDVSRVTESEGENDDIGKFTHSFGNPGLKKILEHRMMENSGSWVPPVGVEFNEQTTNSSSGYSKRMRVWEGEKCVKKVSRETHRGPVSEPLCVEQGIPDCASLIQEPVQEDTCHARPHEIRRAMQWEENRRNNGCGSKQVENGMAAGGIRLMAEGRMVGWDDLANLADGTIVQVLGNIRAGMGKKSGKRKEKNPWESDGSGVPSWAQEVPWSEGSLAEEQFDAIKKDELMEQVEKDLGSGAVDALSKMETSPVQELLTKLEENLAGISDESRKIAVWSLMWMAEKKREELREKGERGRNRRRRR